MPMKILWALLDIATIVVLGSGLYLWLRRKDVSREVKEAGTGPAADVIEPRGEPGIALTKAAR
jgi:uncharacterized iron-regulated membrane protein